MKVQKFEDEKSWLEARRGRITGSRLASIYSSRGTRKIGFYELIAERLGIPADGEDPRDRGHRLEQEAIERYEAVTDQKVKRGLVIWSRDDEPRIACSPDGWVDREHGVEVKCLSTARHIQAVLEVVIPDDYYTQGIQTFCANDDLQTLDFIFYDPRLKVADFLVIPLRRADVLDDIKSMMVFQRKTLSEVDEAVAKLTAF